MDRSVEAAAARAGISEDQARAFLEGLRDEPGYSILDSGMDHWIGIGGNDVMLGPEIVGKLWVGCLNKALAST